MLFSARITMCLFGGCQGVESNLQTHFSARAPIYPTVLFPFHLSLGPRAGRPRNSLPAGSLTASMHSGHSEPPPGPKVESPAVLLRGVMGITQEDIHLFASKFGAVQDVVLKPGLQALIYMENVDAAGRLLQECGTSAEIKDTPVQLKSVDLEGFAPSETAGSIQ